MEKSLADILALTSKKSKRAKRFSCFKIYRSRDLINRNCHRKNCFMRARACVFNFFEVNPWPFRIRTRILLLWDSGIHNRDDQWMMLIL